MDMGSHCIDLLEMFMGRVTEVSAFNSTLTHKYEVEDSSLVMLRFESGALGIVDNNFNIPDASALNILEVYGTCGSVEARGTIGQSSFGKMVARIEENIEGYEASQTREASVEEEVTVDPVNIYQVEIEDVNSAIRGKRKPANPGREDFGILRLYLLPISRQEKGV